MTATTAIPQSFTKPGYRYSLIEQCEDLAIYSQTHAAAGRLLAYEVHIIRCTTKDAEFHGRTIPSGTPIHPSSEQWGTYGWTHGTIEAARARVERELEKRETAP